ncbi:hypothetical protein M407DRAFT_84529 [Tulasnella calospora MUT 4182]|uniref:CxC2-like cysteine cluster KDZ transposase-associated domain-containing protein n=1 Tax=Tulasnella calospora MUT 4182 TaxID=1051891 RepID=A0A0C3L8Y6_9AGAM|nr:hypothetical protein M407DRAFT_84529 [Tulasnella calospora MUT 4182]
MGHSSFRSEYLPYLFAAKAPSRLPLQCSNYLSCSHRCSKPSSANRFFRCTQCFGRRILCASCLLDAHQFLPFHWPEVWWKDTLPARYGYFKRTSLVDLGLQVGLGHDGAFCPQTHENDAFRMTILHTTGQHTVSFRPCACSGTEIWQQLLGVDIFPATEKSPQSGFTFEVLRHQRCFNLRAKTSLKEYYDALVDLTLVPLVIRAPNQLTLHNLQTLYDQLRLVVRLYRILTTHMRAGRSDASAPLKNGELCVICPACPQPGVNLPERWDSDPLK